MATLAPAPFPVGLFPSYILAPTTVLSLGRKYSLSGDYYDVLSGPQNYHMFRCTDSVNSSIQAKYLSSPQGHQLLSISRPVISRGRYGDFTIFDSNGSPLLSFQTIRTTFPDLALISITYTNPADRRLVELRLQGNTRDHSAIITIGERGPEVARIFRIDANNYQSTIAPRVDVLILAAISLCWMGY